MNQKGRNGIVLSFYAVLAIVLAALGQTLLCGLLLGVVILSERNEWVSRQVMQAFFAMLFVDVVEDVLRTINVFGSIPVAGHIISVIFDVISGLVSLAVLVFLIIGLTRVLKGQDAGIPVFTKWAARAYGYVERRMPPMQQPPYQQPQQPNFQQPPYQQPQQPNFQQAPQAPQAPQNQNPQR